MSILFLLIFVVSTTVGQEFSTRPTNVSILLLHFTHQYTSSHTILGPFGVWSLMSGLSFGASGDTSREIFRAFLLYTNITRFNIQYKDLTQNLFNEGLNGVTVYNHNYLFVDNDFPILPYFTNMLISDYETSVKVLDFDDASSAARIANKYIESRSTRVRNVFNSDDFKDSSIIMSNVLYFKGLWSTPFNTSETFLGQVKSSDGKTAVVPMMRRKMKIPYSHMDDMKATIMELPYGDGGKYCMLMLTPDPNVNTQEVYRNFEKVTFRNIFEKLQKDVNETGLKEIDVKLPKFAKSSKLQLQKPLNDMGVYDAFDPENARFARMVQDSIYIETVEHNAVIVITETGTFAYATTPGLNGNTNDKVNEPEVMPPFIFFIIEKLTATVLFGGIFA